MEVDAVNVAEVILCDVSEMALLSRIPRYPTPTDQSHLAIWHIR